MRVSAPQEPGESSDPTPKGVLDWPTRRSQGSANAAHLHRLAGAPSADTRAERTCRAETAIPKISFLVTKLVTSSQFQSPALI